MKASHTVLNGGDKGNGSYRALSLPNSDPEACMEDIQWEGDSFCMCDQCDYRGTVQDFRVPTVMCKFCDTETPARTAHLHQGSWVGDACCWDSRLEVTA